MTLQETGKGVRGSALPDPRQFCPLDDLLGEDEGLQEANSGWLGRRTQSPAAWEDTLSHTAESVCVCPCTGQAAFKDVLLGDTPSLITKKKVTEMGKPQNEQIQMLNRTVNTSSSSLRYKNQP